MSTSISQRILYFRVRSLISSFPEVATAAIAIPIMTYFMIPQPMVLTWVGSYVLGAVGFLIVNLKYHRTLSEDDSAERLIRIKNTWFAQTIFFAVHWGALSWIIDRNDLSSLTLLGFVLSGVTSGQTITTISFPKIIRVYALIVGIPFVGRLIYLGNSQLYPLAIMVTVYIFLLFRIQKSLIKHFFRTYGALIDLEKANKKIKTTQEAAIHSSRLAAQAEMTAHLAHEVNNPLAIIHLKLEFLLRSLKKGKIDESLVKDVCNKSIEMVDRIQNIIDATKKYFYHNNEEDFRTEVELRELIDEIVGIYQEKCRIRGIEFKREGNDELSVYGGRTAVLQVVTNLLNNAFDAVKDQTQPSIRISTESDDKKVIIRVEDSGEQIANEIRDKIFEPFYTTKSKGAGLGLGLSICMGLARDMGGDLWLEEGAPTTFCLCLKKVDPLNEKVIFD